MDEHGDFQLESVYRDHHRLVAWLVRSAVAESAADDVIQDVFVAIHRRRAQAPGEQLRKWVVGVTRSVCHSHRRGTARRNARLDALPPPPPPPAAEDVLDDRAALRRVHDVLLQIEPGQREVFSLIELEGLSAPEAAELTGEPLNTVYSRLRLARRKLASAIDTPQRAVDAARREGPRSRARAQQTWAAIAIRIGREASVTAASVTSTAAATSAGWLWPTVLLGAAATLTILATSLGTNPPPPVATARHSVVVAEADAPEPATARPTSSTIPTAAPPPEPARTATPEPQPAAITPARKRRRAKPAVRLPPEAATTPPSTLVVEAALLTKAARHLDAGQSKDAAALLAEHAERFPEGELREERARLLKHMAAEEKKTPSP